LFGVGTKVKMQKGNPPTLEELEQEIRKLYPTAETPVVSHGITHQLHPKVNNFKKRL
jgi:hypothetical protein